MNDYLGPESSLRRKPRVLLVPDVSVWILGEIARQIVRHYRDRYDFYYISELVLRRRPDLQARFLKGVDFVHALTQYSARLLSQTPITRRPPMMTWIHHIVDWSPAHAAAVENSQMIIAVTESWAKEIRSQANRPVRCQVVPLGVDVQRFRRMPASRKLFGIPQGNFTVGFVGANGRKNYHRKGVDIFLKLVEQLEETLPRLHVTLAGVGWEEIGASLRKSGISSNVVPFIQAKHMAKFYSCLDAYVVTSRLEGGPSTVLEAMACEVPVVATRVGMMSGVLNNGQNGYLVDVGDLESLAHALKDIAANLDRARALGKNGRATVANQWTWEKTLKNLEEPYEEMSKAAARSLTEEPPALPSPEHLQCAVHAADAFIWGKNHIRRRHPRFASGIHLLREMADGTSRSDVCRGIGLLTGAWLRFPLFKGPKEEPDQGF